MVGEVEVILICYEEDPASCLGSRKDDEVVFEFCTHRASNYNLIYDLQFRLLEAGGSHVSDQQVYCILPHHIIEASHIPTEDVTVTL